MKQGYSHISFLLDKSGSMNRTLNDTIGGFNTFLKSQKETPGEATFSLSFFSTIVTDVNKFVPINCVEELGLHNYMPMGNTALYDAIGKMVIDTGLKLDSMDEDKKPEKVIFVILTDGEENASKEYKYDTIKSMIEFQSKNYSWEFVFLGANLDAKAVGTGLGIKAGNSMTFAQNSQGIGSTFASMSCNLSGYRTMGRVDSNYTFFKEEDEQRQKEAGA